MCYFLADRFVPILVQSSISSPAGPESPDPVGNYAKSRHGKRQSVAVGRISQRRGRRRRRKESWRKVDAPNELNLFGMDGWMEVPGQQRMDGQPMAAV